MEYRKIEGVAEYIIAKMRYSQDWMSIWWVCGIIGATHHLLIVRILKPSFAN